MSNKDRTFLAGNRFGKSAMVFNEVASKCGIKSIRMNFSEYMDILYGYVTEEDEEMSFKDLDEGQTHYLDENGDVIDPLEGESLEQWREWQRAMMNDTADEIRERLEID